MRSPGSRTVSRTRARKDSLRRRRRMRVSGKLMVLIVRQGSEIRVQESVSGDFLGARGFPFFPQKRAERMRQTHLVQGPVSAMVQNRLMFRIAAAFAEDYF